MDIQRYLNYEPVTAAAPSVLYRAQKFARRHRAALAAAILGMLVAGVVVSALLAVRATRAERQQSLFRKEAETAQATEAGLRKKAVAGEARLLEALDRLESQRAEELFAAGDNSRALANLARALRQNPSKEVTAARMLSALTLRGFAVGFARRLKLEAEITFAALSPDGRRMVTGSFDKTARIWDVNTGQPLTGPIKHEDAVLSVQFSTDGQRVVTASKDKTARVWDAKTGKPLTEPLKHEKIVISAEFSPEGERVVTASADKTARVWDSKTGKPLTGPFKHEAEVYAAHFSPDGQRVVTASADKTARVWDANTGLPVSGALTHEAEVRSAQFSPDGQRVVTASFDKSAQVWDANTGQPLTVPMKHEDAVLSVQFSSDGQRVVSASWDKTARVWDAKTGQPLSELLRHPAPVRSARFSLDSQRVLTASEDSTARIWHVPVVPLPVPRAVVELVQSVAGQRFNDQGVREPVDGFQIRTLQHELSSISSGGVWTRWANWFFGDPFARTISPFSEITVPEYVNECIREGTVDSLEEAIGLAPTNGVVLARLARTLLAQQQSTPTKVGEADWYSQRAVRFAPAEAEAHWARAEALERTGKFLEALEEIKGPLEIQPRNAELWHAQGRMLERASHNDEAYQSLTKAIELAAGRPGAANQPPTMYYLSRSKFLKRQNRLEEAAADFRVAKGIPPRDPQAGGDLIDLSLYYNVGLTESWHTGSGTSDLSELRRGIQTLAGIQFDVRGLIQVGAESRTGETYPTKVADIAIQRACQRLHFLHAAIDAFSQPDGTRIGSYVIRYSNGRQSEFPIVIGVSLADWFDQPNEENKTFTIAWTGQNAASRRQGRKIRLFRSTWENPAPGETVRSIDFVWTASEAAPFLVAITAEP